MTLLAARLAAYEPDGPRFETALLDPSSWDATFAFNDAGSLQVKYARELDPIGMLGRPVELAAELWDGTTWVEPRNARYVATEDQSDDAADLDVASYTLKSYATLLNRVQVLARPDNPVFPDSDRPDYTDDGSREFWTATAGQVILSLLNEHRQRYGTLPGLTVDFTSTHDSAGHPWAEVRSLTYSPGTTLLDVLADLASYALIDWWVEGRKLRVFNAGTQQVDRTVRMHLVDAESAPVRGSWDGIATVIRLEGVDGQTWEKAVPGAPTWWGPKVRTVVNSSVADDATAQAILDNEALLAASKRTEYTRTLKDFKQRPLLDFQVGDTIPAKNALGAFEQMRVFEIGLSLDTDGLLSSALTLNDRFVDADVRFQRRLKGATSGADDVGGDGSIPNNLTPAVPAQVKGLTVGTLGYWKGAVPRSSVQVDWADVSADVNGYAIELLRYDVEVSGRTTAVPAADIGQRPPSQAGIANLDIDTPVVVRVRAVSATGVPGAWSASVSIVTDRPYMLMDPPTAFVPTAENGIVTVSWDGRLQGSGDSYSPPSYFDRVDVYESELSSGPWTRIGTVRAGMLILDRQSILGETRFYRGVAVDVLGAESDPGPSASVVVTSWISQQISDAQASVADAAAEAADAKAQAQAAHDEAMNAQATANGAASDLLTLAGKTGQLIYQESAPTGTRADSKNLWIKTSTGQPYQYNGTTWVLITDSRITSAAQAAASAADAAALAMTTANGKNTIYYQTGTPASPKAGDRWYNPTSGLAQIWTGAAWRSTTPGDGFVPALDIGSGTAGDMSVGRLTVTGGATIPVAVINSLVGDDAFLKSLYANRVVVSGNGINAIANSGFENGATGWNLDSSMAVQTADAHSGSNRLYVPPKSSGTSQAYTGQVIPVTPGQVWRFGGWVVTSTSWNGTSGNSKFRLGDGGNSYLTAAPYTSGGWHYVSGTYEVPATGVTEIQLRAVFDHTAGNIYIDDMDLTLMQDGSLLVDGAVTADKVMMDEGFANKFWANEGNFGKVTTQMFSTQAAFSGAGVKIDRTGVVTTRSDGSTVTQSADGILVKDPSGEELVRLGYGISTGLAVRNPVSGSMVELAWQAFVAQSAYGDDSSSPNGAGSGITEYWNANESVYEDFNTKYIPYGPVVTFTTGWTGNIEIATGGKVAITCKSTCNEAGSAIANLALYLAPEILSGTTQVVAPQRFAGGFIQASSLASGSGNSDVDNVLMSLSGSTRLSLTPNTTYTARIRVCLNRYIFFSGANRANASLSLEKMWISVRQIA